MTQKKTKAKLERINSISVKHGAALWQKLFALFVFLGITVLTVYSWKMMATTFISLSIICFFIIITYKIPIVLMAEKGIVKFSKGLIDDLSCPYVTVMVAMVDEVSVLEKLINSLAQQDYPKNKLTIYLVLEEWDHPMREAGKKLKDEGKLPDNFEFIVVPKDWLPGLKGKPRALNFMAHYGFIKGSITALFDAEDEPNRTQIREAATAARDYPKVSCFQAELRWYNANVNFLTRMAAASYAMNAMQFAGLCATNGVTPLCGTSFYIRSNVLKKLGYWDEWCVTEDLLLGVHLTRAGYRTMMLPSVTEEEATETYIERIGQESRWTKGFLTGTIAETRNPFWFVRDYGRNVLSFFVVVMSHSPATLIVPVFWALTIYYALTRDPLIQELTPQPIFYLGEVCLLANIIFIQLAMWATIRSKQYAVTPWTVLILFYWLFVGTPAGATAVYEWSTGKKAFWRKTRHGITKTRKEFVHAENIGLSPVVSSDS